jgi:hypothetical protein
MKCYTGEPEAGEKLRFFWATSAKMFPVWEANLGTVYFSEGPTDSSKK